ncbi:4-hydroxybenzoate octaprenyltransferase [Desulfonatronospira sp.]|uniref:4-hydroxybenzoate octaprenyltransferase n=1 Tax=Desulfonatronospira sp. TaxID=1962951 RepID=UPI0025B7DD8C|nr:4-hydroxybenzoate octaprenyltransferase [Desulfonatronospira sp.]
MTTSMASKSPGLIRAALAWARMIRIEHSIFALPFAYMGLFWSAQGWPGWRIFVFLTLAMVMVRSFAMTHNRLADLPLDALNPRTRDRALVTGEIRVKEAYLFLGVSAALFLFACAFINLPVFLLAFLALGWSAVYSYTKRWTSLCHFFLGSVLGLAPLAGWIAFVPELTLPAVFLFLGVLFWVGGFDILYATQDAGFDRENGLKSIPARHGLETSFALAGFAHVNAALFFLLAGITVGATWPYYLAWVIVAAVLYIEHKLISPDNLEKLNVSFFTLNALVSLILLAGVLGDVFLVSA